MLSIIHKKHVESLKKAIQRINEKLGVEQDELLAPIEKMPEPVCLVINDERYFRIEDLPESESDMSPRARTKTKTPLTLSDITIEHYHIMGFDNRR